MDDVKTTPREKLENAGEKLSVVGMVIGALGTIIIGGIKAVDLFTKKKNEK